MSKVVVFGLEGEDGLWQADLEAGTVVALDTGPAGDMTKLKELRNADTPLTKGIDFAVTISTAHDQAGGFLETSGGFLETSGGFLETSGGFLETSGGFMETSGGLLETSGGFLETSGRA